MFSIFISEKEQKQKQLDQDYASSLQDIKLDTIKNEIGEVLTGLLLEGDSLALKSFIEALNGLLALKIKEGDHRVLITNHFFNISFDNYQLKSINLVRA